MFRQGTKVAEKRFRSGHRILFLIFIVVLKSKENKNALKDLTLIAKETAFSVSSEVKVNQTHVS